MEEMRCGGITRRYEIISLTAWVAWVRFLARAQSMRSPVQSADLSPFVTIKIACGGPQEVGQYRPSSPNITIYEVGAEPGTTSPMEFIDGMTLHISPAPGGSSECSTRYKVASALAAANTASSIHVINSREHYAAPDSYVKVLRFRARQLTDTTSNIAARSATCRTIDTERE